MPGIGQFIFKTLPVLAGSVIAVGIAASTAVAIIKERHQAKYEQACHIQQQYEQQCAEQEELQRQQQYALQQCRQQSSARRSTRSQKHKRRSCSPKKKKMTVDHWLTRPRLELLQDASVLQGGIFADLKTLQVLKVTYDCEKRVCLGNKLRVGDTQRAPKVQVHRHSTHHVECVETRNRDQDGYYTLMMLDPDAPSRALPSLRNILHWLVVNIPICDSRKLAIRSGNTLAVYVPPNPPAGAGYHRYVFVLYWQRERLDVSNMPIIGTNEIGPRLNFNVGQFAARFNTQLTLVEFNYFLAHNNALLPAPAAPTTLTATPNTTSIVLTWTDNTNNEAHYLLERSTNNNMNFIQINSLNPDVTTYTDTNLAPNTTYYYRVRASNNGGRSAYSNTASARTTGTTGNAPTAPTNVIATAGNGQVILNWNAVTNATSYVARYSLTSGGPYINGGQPVTGTTATVTGLNNGTPYFFVVVARNSTGDSPNSTQVTATPSTTGAVPLAPTGLTATRGNNQISLTWNSSTGASTYAIRRSTNNGGPYTQIVSGLTGNTYTDNGAANGTPYYYVITATNAAGTSPDSPQIAVPI